MNEPSEAEINRLEERLDRVAELAGAFENQAEVIARLGLIGHQLDRVLEFPGGEIEAAGVVVDEPAIVVGRAEEWIGGEGANEVILGLVVFSLLDEVVGERVFFASELGVLSAGFEHRIRGAVFR